MCVCVGGGGGGAGGGGGGGDTKTNSGTCLRHFCPAAKWFHSQFLESHRKTFYFAEAKIVKLHGLLIYIVTCNLMKTQRIFSISQMETLLLANQSDHF